LIGPPLRLRPILLMVLLFFYPNLPLVPRWGYYTNGKLLTVANVARHRSLRSLSTRSFHSGFRGGQWPAFVWARFARDSRQQAFRWLSPKLTNDRPSAYHIIGQLHPNAGHCMKCCHFQRSVIIGKQRILNHEI
jgi:hypothetical protein